MAVMPPRSAPGLSRLCGVATAGIRPDLVVEIRADLRDEVDGPMLEHGLKGRHGQPLMALPAVRAERPDRELLDRRYARFRTAG